MAKVKMKKKSGNLPLEQKPQTPDYLADIPKLPSDYPDYIDPKTGKFKKGHSGNPDGCPKGIIYKSARIKHQLLSFFEDGYINKGKFLAWVRIPGNEKLFFDYIMKNILPKDVNMAVEGGESLADILKAARARKDAKK